MIDPTDENVREVASVADYIDAMLLRRGFEPLTTDQKDTLWGDYPAETAAMLDKIESRSGIDAEAMEIAREHIAGLLPAYQARQFLSGIAA